MSGMKTWIWGMEGETRKDLRDITKANCYTHVTESGVWGGRQKNKLKILKLND